MAVFRVRNVLGLKIDPGIQLELPEQGPACGTHALSNIFHTDIVGTVTGLVVPGSPRGLSYWGLALGWWLEREAKAEGAEKALLLH